MCALLLSGGLKVLRLRLRLRNKIRKDDIRQALRSHTTLLDKVVQQNLWWFGQVERMTIYQIPHNALHATFEGKRNEDRPRLRCIDNANEDIESVWLTLRGATDWTEVIHSYLSLPNGWGQKLVITMTFAVVLTVWGRHSQGPPLPGCSIIFGSRTFRLPYPFSITSTSRELHENGKYISCLQ